MTVATGGTDLRKNVNVERKNVNVRNLATGRTGARINVSAKKSVNADARKNANVKKRNPGSVIFGVGAIGDGLPDL